MGVTFRTPSPIDLPSAGTVIENVERSARTGAREAGDLVESTIRGRAPSRTGSASGAVHARVTQRALGIGLRVSPDNKVHPSSNRSSSRNLTNLVVWRFIEGGTGIAGPRHQLIKKRGKVFYNGAIHIPSGRGQAPNSVFEQTFAAVDGQVIAILARARAQAMRMVIR